MQTFLWQYGPLTVSYASVTAKSMVRWERSWALTTFVGFVNGVLGVLVIPQSLHRCVRSRALIARKVIRFLHGQMSRLIEVGVRLHVLA